MLDWNSIETVFLDLDGTLLDLQFDNHFWHTHVPRRFAERFDLAPEDAKTRLLARYKAMEGTLEWYCLDYWSRELGLDLVELKREVEHLIAVHPHVIPFLRSLRTLGKRVVLTTNAHAKSLAIKLTRTGLDAYFDAVICAHDFLTPKEDPDFWRHLEIHEPFLVEATLLVDDNVSVLQSARTHGIRYLYGVMQPDSGAPARSTAEFPMIRDFRDLMPAQPLE